MITINKQERIEWTPDMTVRELLHEIGQASMPVLVAIDGQAVRPTAYDTTLVPDEAKVQIIHIAAGG
jgi:thiamine biosynthesis protein ThiS